jgi:TetR/AcrR family transcriptional regulator
MAARLQTDSHSARQDRGSDTRAVILAAAEGIFAEEGLEGARTDEITSRAGVNKALLYYYFESKEALFRAVLESHLKEFQSRIFDILDSPASARSKLIRYINLHFDFISARPYYPRLIHRLITSDDRALRRLFRQYASPLYRKMVEVIEQGVRERELRPVDSHHTVYSLLALNVFYFSAAPLIKAVTHIDPLDQANVQRRKEEVLRFVRYGLFRNPEASSP